MKRTETARKREAINKLDEFRKRLHELKAVLESLPNYEKLLRQGVAEMPDVVRQLPVFQPLRTSLFQFKDLVRTMNKNYKTLAKRMKRIEEGISEADSQKINKTLDAQLKILTRMKKDGDRLIAESLKFEHELDRIVATGDGESD